MISIVFKSIVIDFQLFWLKKYILCMLQRHYRTDNSNDMVFFMVDYYSCVLQSNSSTTNTLIWKYHWILVILYVYIENKDHSYRFFGILVLLSLLLSCCILFCHEKFQTKRKKVKLSSLDVSRKKKSSWSLEILPDPSKHKQW